MSTDLLWLLLRNNNSKLVKRSGVRKQLSAEKGNLAVSVDEHGGQPAMLIVTM